MKILANNPKAHHDYFVLEKFEAGIVLTGTEIKSLREFGGSIKEAHVNIDKNEAYIVNMHIAPYEKGNIFNKDPKRIRKLLLHKKEILKLEQAVKEKGITVIPLNVHLSGRCAKIEIGLCKGKKLYDKRETIKQRDIKRTIERELN